MIISESPWLHGSRGRSHFAGGSRRTKKGKDTRRIRSCSEPNCEIGAENNYRTDRDRSIRLSIIDRGDAGVAFYGRRLTERCA